VVTDLQGRGGDESAKVRVKKLLWGNGLAVAVSGLPNIVKYRIANAAQRGYPHRNTESIRFL
jgi:hypothetical protein